MKKIQLNFIGASKPSPIGANQVTLDFIAQKITLLLTKSPIMLQNIFDDGLFKNGRFSLSYVLKMGNFRSRFVCFCPFLIRIQMQLLKE